MATNRRKAEKNIAKGLATIKFAPKTENQAKYVKTIEDNTVTICVGPPGTGKTSVAVAMACKYLAEGKVDKIVITRPTVEASNRGLGFLKGSYEEKVYPYLIPILDELNKYLGPIMVQELMQCEIIQISPIEYMRGRNVNASFLIGDEFQNATVHQIKLVLTRLGEGSKCVISGDPNQRDLQDSGLEFVKNKLEGLEGVGVMELGVEDIVRHDIIGKILRRLES